MLQPSRGPQKLGLVLNIHQIFNNAASCLQQQMNPCFIISFIGCVVVLGLPVSMETVEMTLWPHIIFAKQKYTNLIRESFSTKHRACLFEFAGVSALVVAVRVSLFPVWLPDSCCKPAVGHLFQPLPQALHVMLFSESL